MVHQHFKLIGPFTVAENVLLANPAARFRTGIRRITQAIRDNAAQIGFSIDPAQRIDDLSVAEQQRVEILKILIGGADILILDEPTAVLTDQEATGLLTTLRRMTAQGTAVVLVTHKLRNVVAYADRATVMRGGRTLATVDPRAATVEDLSQLAVGEDIAAPSRAADPAPREGPPLCGRAQMRPPRRPCHGPWGDIFGARARDLWRRRRQRQRADGTGRGIDGHPSTARGHHRDRGERRYHPRHAGRAAGYQHGGDPRRPLRLRPRRRAVGSPTIWRQAACATAAMGGGGAPTPRRCGATPRRPSGPSTFKACARSARRRRCSRAATRRSWCWRASFGRTPAVVVAHSPSRGLDARACAAVHARLLAARHAGAAILLISDDLDEVLSSDRIGVMARGRIVAEFDAPADRQSVGRAMVHHA